MTIIPIKTRAKKGHYRLNSISIFRPKIYRLRSNVEEVFSVIKRLFNGTNRSRTLKLSNKETKLKNLIYNIHRSTQLPKKRVSTKPIFKKDFLIKVLEEDMMNEESSHDFGKDIIPKLVKEDRKVYACPFEGYWVDVGTIPNYYDVSMDLLNPDSKIWEMNWDMKILSSLTPSYIDDSANVKRSLVSNGGAIKGKVSNSILSDDVDIEEGAIVEDSILMGEVKIKKGCHVKKAIISENLTVNENLGDGKEIILVN